MAIDPKLMDTGWKGAPFVKVVAKESVVTTTMDIGFRGIPFVIFAGTAATGGSESYVLKVAGVAQASISKVAGVANASANKIAGVQNII